MNQRFSRPEKTFSREDKAMQKNVYARRHLDADLEAQQGLERIHLQTIRNEKMRLQKELERMRGRGQRVLGRRTMTGMQRINTTKLTQLRLNRESTNGMIRSRYAPAGRSTSPVSGSAGDSLNNTASVPLEAVGRSPRSSTLELPAINPGNRSSRSPRNGFRGSNNNNNRYELEEDFIREQQMLEHKKNLSKKQEELLARVEKFGEDLGSGLKQRDGSGDTKTRSPTEHSDKSDDGMTINSDPSSSFPPPGKTKSSSGVGRTRSNSFSEYDLKNIKQSITKRLVGEERGDHGRDTTAAPLTQEKQLSRTVSTTSSMGTTTSKSRKKTSQGSEPRPMEMIFDQETYAPDGSLRTVHMLPDPNDSFAEAKKARYLRWRGPREIDTELTITEIFSKENPALERKESTVSSHGQF